MHKLLKIFMLALLFFICSYVCSYATEEDTLNNDVVEETPSSGLSSLTQSSYTTNVSPVNSYSQANLELNNILSVILIAVGVVIILLAIAILIKIKK